MAACGGKGNEEFKEEGMGTLVKKKDGKAKGKRKESRGMRAARANSVTRAMTAVISEWNKLDEVMNGELTFAKLDIDCWGIEKNQKSTKAKIKIELKPKSKGISDVKLVKNNEFSPEFVMPRDEIWICVKGSGDMELYFTPYNDLFSITPSGGNQTEMMTVKVPSNPDDYREVKTAANPTGKRPEWMGKVKEATIRANKPPKV